MHLDVVAIAALVRSCPLVDGLHGGSHGRIVTSGDDGRQVGVLLAGSTLVVGVVGAPGATTEDVAAQVRTALSAPAPHCRVTVSVRHGQPVASD